MSTARVMTSTRTTHVDQSTGEILSTEEVNVVRIPEPPYVKMYIDDLADGRTERRSPVRSVRAQPAASTMRGL